jgi:hypothetical protein
MLHGGLLKVDFSCNLLHQALMGLCSALLVAAVLD